LDIAVTLRESTRGTLAAKLWVMAVWQWESSDERARRRWLAVRREQDGTFKHSLNHAPATTAWNASGNTQHSIRKGV
jgi:hypothetical protein